MDYKIIMYTPMLDDSRADAVRKLEEIVKAYLEQGWELLGGVCVDRGTLYQTVYYEKK